MKESESCFFPPSGASCLVVNPSFFSCCCICCRFCAEEASSHNSGTMHGGGGGRARGRVSARVRTCTHACTRTLIYIIVPFAAFPFKKRRFYIHDRKNPMAHNQQNVDNWLTVCQPAPAFLSNFTHLSSYPEHLVHKYVNAENIPASFSPFLSISENL